MAASKPHLPPVAPGVEFRNAIEKAVAAGTALDQMTLLLTVGDASRLRRDRTLADDDIRYSEGGGMEFLGVRVVTGGVASSRLEQGVVEQAAAG